MIKTVIDKISDWSKLPLEQRYNFLLGTVVVALVGVIYFQEQKRAELRLKCELEQKEHLNYPRNARAKAIFLSIEHKNPHNRRFLKNQYILP